MNLELLSLQWYQETHDRLFHRDIYTMQRVPRINHLVHHMRKYLTAYKSGEYRLNDMLAVALSLANVMPTNLSKRISKIQGELVVNVESLKPYYTQSAESLISILDVELSNFSKLIEGFDHIESLDYNGGFNTGATDVFMLVIQLCVDVKVKTMPDADFKTVVIELIKDYHTHMTNLKKRNPFYDYLNVEMRRNEHNLTLDCWITCHNRPR